MIELTHDEEKKCVLHVHKLVVDINYLRAIASHCEELMVLMR